MVDESGIPTAAAVEPAPRGSNCERCGKPAEQRIVVARSRLYHHDRIFCRPCGEQYLLALDGIIANLLSSTSSSVYQ